MSERGDALAAEDVRELAAGVERASWRLRRLVGNLRAAAQLDREGVELGTRPVRLGEILDRAGAEFENGARLQAVAEDDVRELRVWADVELAVADGGPGEVAISVSDRGPGVPAEMQDQIFDAFTQAEDGMDRRHEGLGIGLFLARRIMHPLGGEVSATEREGGGSVFTLTFVAMDDRAPVEQVT